MTCRQYGHLLHAFLDGELDAGHMHELETHVPACPRCAAELRDYREMRLLLSDLEMKYNAPASLCRSIERSLPPPRANTSVPKHRGLVRGFAMGSMVSAALAASLAFFVMLGQQDQFAVDELLSAHLRSLQSGRLIDVESNDQRTVKPWFNGRVQVVPPVIDLATEGFTLIGGRLDYLDAQPVAALVYKRGGHVINLFIGPASTTRREVKLKPELQGFNVLWWSWSEFPCSAVSDINPAELQEFGAKFQAAVLRGES
jgi:anti-sigma factor RsiW